MLDIVFDMFGLEVGGADWSKGGKSSEDHSVMNLCAEFIA